MKLIFKLIFLLASNAIALAIADYFVSGFDIQPTWQAYLEVIAVFTLINLLVRPILKLVLSPIIFITLGLGVIIVNALVLYALDWLVTGVTIAGLYPLVYATLIISIANFAFHFSAKRAYAD
ncbi:MAG: hypothetical protein UV58_C0005G0039 [Candidatus Wolfebacteria bacterium GW2011_GWC1_43_10]|uniref:Phage holin family protein n=2 Tax=Candidatus Wolfeibacteriota TaxID=1752735 RepID=A0A0G1CAU9_9BACT|nr:MAG: hypothetical protein UV58_C0005G0039 [Candidatus Wolfebacteria bacterium GW2011_GWC1_43_10]KKT23172.1 MAG: putative membrane protein [Parcubacteria group bacterium GW2011_GWB1_43_8b]OGM89286.1 MAG: hypothetical protein A2108_00225 [Candidatus Wolfebacteria bacterium GWA1_42_9]